MPTFAAKPQRARRISTDLEELIRGAIERGELKPGQRLGSAKQLAKFWKTSYGAARQSLELLAAKGLVERRPRAGTFVSSNAETLGTQSDARNIIGLLVPDIRIPDYSLIARHLQDAGHKANFEVLVSSTDNERERYDQSVLRHLKAGVGGLVLVAPHQGRLSLSTLVELEKSGVPVVNYARRVDVVSWPTVQTDTTQAAYLPVKHLCDIGRRRIGYLSYPSDTHGAEMMFGLYRAIAEAGLTAENISILEIADTNYLSSWSDRSSLEQILEKWLDENPKLDAVCCMHVHIAATLLTLLSRRGVRVPEDIAVTSHGNMPEVFGVGAGELTTVDTHSDKAAEEMVRVLRHRSDDPGDQLPSIISIQPQLLIGRSTVKTEA